MDATEMHLAAYERVLKARGRSEWTIQGYLEALGQLAEFDGGDDITAVEKGTIEEWMAAILAAPKRNRINHQGSTAAIRFRQARAFYNWADSGGSEGDAMALFGWASSEMPRRYGASAKVERAQRASKRISPADRF